MPEHYALLPKFAQVHQNNVVGIDVDGLVAQNQLLFKGLMALADGHEAVTNVKLILQNYLKGDFLGFEVFQLQKEKSS